MFALNNINNNNNTTNNNNNNNNNNGNGLRLSAQGMETLQAFLRDHGNECIRQFVQVSHSFFIKILMFSIFMFLYSLRLLFC